MLAAGPKKYAFIDALRGLAFLGVLACHIGQSTPGLPRFADALLNNGDKGVQLFFMVSALTLFLSLDARMTTESRPTLAFFLRRFFRIAPLFYLGAVVYLSFPVAQAIARGRPVRDWSAFLPSGPAILSTLTFTNGWAPDWINLVVPGGWSIAVEMNFYLLVPWLHRRLRTIEGVLAFALATSLGAFALNAGMARVLAAGPIDRESWVVPLFLRWWLPNQLPIFALGILLHRLIRHRFDSNASPRFGLAALAFAGAVSLYAVLAHSGVDWRHPNEMVLYGGPLFLAAYSLALYPLRIVVNPLLCHAGKVSFSGYLAHFAVIRAVNRLLLWIPPLPAEGRLALLWVLVLGGTLALATLSFHLVEIPGQALGKRLIARLERDRSLDYAGRSAGPAVA